MKMDVDEIEEGWKVWGVWCVDDLHAEEHGGYQHGHYIDNYATEAEAIAAWNTRAERTCEWKLEHSGTLYDKWRCSECGYLFVEPRCDQGYMDLESNYCPSCGAKVVE